MFTSKKSKPAIDPEQKELIDNARKRIKEKRGLFTHFMIFLVAAIGLILISQVLMQQEPPRLLNIQWWVWIIFVWLLLIIYHTFKVFITNRLLGPEWEKRQYEKLVAQQKGRLEILKDKVNKESPMTQQSTPQRITMIAAAGANNELGKDGDLVWHLPDDFKRFKSLTTGHHIIMGRKTFESFPKPLPNRTHIILTRDKNYQTEHGIVVHDLKSALALTKSDKEPFIIGGGEIYTLGLDVADRIELTRVHGKFEVDTYFPEFSDKEWKLVRTEHHPADERHKYAFDFETWERI